MIQTFDLILIPTKLATNAADLDGVSPLFNGSFIFNSQ